MGYYVHPDRYSTTSVASRKRLIVVHTSEGGELSTSDETLMRLMAQPGDRDFDPPSPTGEKYGAAYQAVADGDREDYHEMMFPADHYGTYSAAGVNKWAWNIVHPGRASQTRAQWLDPRSRGQIKGVAKFCVDKHHIDDIAMRWLTVEQVRLTADPRTGVTGICGHHEVALAFKRTDHTDPDPNYPRDVLLSDIGKLLAPPPLPLPPIGEPDMVLDWQPGSPNWTVFGYTLTHLSWMQSGANQAANAAPAEKRVTINSTQLLDIINSSQQTTVPPPTLTPAMLAAWG